MTAVRTSKAPGWLQFLLYLAAEKLAQRGAVDCEFQAVVNPDGVPQTWVASLRFDPVSQTLAMYVHHGLTGRFMCRGTPVEVDEIDPDCWNAEASNSLFDDSDARDGR